MLAFEVNDNGGERWQKEYKKRMRKWKKERKEAIEKFKEMAR